MPKSAFTSNRSTARRLLKNIMSTSNECPDCAGSRFQPDLKAECLRCGGYGRMRLTQRETAPVFRHQFWREFEREQRYERQIWLLRVLAFGLVCVILGVF